MTEADYGTITSPLRLSVAMAVYNGAAFLGEQLRSVREQELRPTEVVICDDASSDGSVAMAQEFASRAPFEVRVEACETNRGVVGNFERAIAACRGEVIVLADQDDRWAPWKLRRIAEVFERRAEVGFVFSDADAIDAEGQPLGYRLWQAVRLSAKDRRLIRSGHAIEVLLRRTVVTGATMAFRSRYRDLVLPMPAFCQHDAWIALLLSAVAPCVAMEEPLIGYRQHAGQQLGEKLRGLAAQYRIAKSETAEKFRLIARRHEAARERLAACGGPNMDPAVMDALAGKVEHFLCKARMRESSAWRLPAIMRELIRGHYVRYSLGWKSLAQDLFL